MSEQITLNVVGGSQKTQKYTVTTENKMFINSIITVSENNTISYSDMRKLQEMIKGGDDAGILEEKDFNPQQKLELAKYNKYNQLYNIKLSDDEKYYEITIKGRSALLCQYPDPTVGVICKDFGFSIEDFKSNNKALTGEITDNARDCNNGHNYSADVVPEGKTFKIPVDKCHFTNGPTDVGMRILHRFGSWFQA